MAQTKIKAAQFSGVIGNGTNGYVLQSSGNGDMEWVANVVNPTVLSVTYPGDDTAADPTGGQTVTITGADFKTGANVTIGGTAATSVSFVSATTLTITTPAKAAGDYDIVVTNTDGGIGTKINAISYNGVPAWTTAAGSLGTFASGETISTITLQASEPDAGTITFDIISGTLPTGLSLTGANINGTTSLETADTLYNFTIEAIDDENQATPRAFSITVTKQFLSTDNFTINTYTGNGSTQSIEGKIGTAAAFNGSSSYIELQNIPLFSGKNTNTVSLWFKSTTTSYSCIFSDYAGTSLNNVIDFNGGTGNFEFNTRYNNVTTSIVTTAGNYNDGEWHHIVSIVDVQNLQKAAYVDGSQIGSTVSISANSWTGDSNQKITIGRLYYTTSSIWQNPFNGFIDQVRIFDKALSSSEITTLYGEPSNPSTASTTDIFNDGSGIALYEFEEGAKDTGGVTGYIGAGGMFDGSSSYIQVNSLPTNSTFSLSFWMKATDPNSDSTLFHFRNSSSHIGANTIGLAASGTQFGWFPYNSTGGAGFTGISASDTNALFDSNWHNVVIVSDSTSFSNSKIYIDGSEKTLTIFNSYTTSVKMEGTLYVGRRSDGANDYNGLIDQIRFFDKALSSSEVTTLYGETSASATKSTTDIFDDSSGIALYELEGNANDSGRFGRGAIDSGQSAVFNGSSSYIDLGSTIDNPLRTAGSFGVSFWFNASSYGTNPVIFKLLNDIYIYIFLNGSNQLECRVSNSSGVQSVITTAVSLNTWYHVVWTGNSANGVTLYLNGYSVGNTSWDGTFYTYTNTGYKFNYLGYNGSSTGWYSGKIDQVRVYSSALSASDVEALVSETNVPTANLVANYKLDSNANDETTNYNGTATSVTYSDPAEFPVYDGTPTNVSYAYDGTPTNVSFVGTSFQPDLVWFKERGSQGFSHGLYDSVRGANRILNSNLTNAETTLTQGLQSFNTNGFAIGNNNQENASGSTYVAWCWKAGGTAVSNTDGSITSTVSANVNAGFSIVKFTAPTGNFTVGHGLSIAPQLIISKNLDFTLDWSVHTSVIDGSWDYAYLNTTDQFNNSSLTLPTSSIFSFAGHISTNDYIAYCFHSADGYQKIGSYTGNGTTSNTVTTGFRPRWLMIKCSSQGFSYQHWFIHDSSRTISGGYTNGLMANLANSEFSNTSTPTFNSNGFTINASGGEYNASGQTYIYLAIA